VTDQGNGPTTDRVQGDDSVAPHAVRAFADGLPGGPASRVLHLQCRSGEDALALAGLGATVVGVDLSRPAILRARARATELGLAERSRFIIADLYDLRHTLPEPESFQAVRSIGGDVGRLPDVAGWARIIEWYLEPGGVLHVSDACPTEGETPVDCIVAALVAAGLEVDEVREDAGTPGWHTIRAHRPGQPLE
jgi:SAM-dependent methyltransferase